jgi:hypothetical protein
MRNYCEVYIARFSSGGNVVKSLVYGTNEELKFFVQSYQLTNPGAVPDFMGRAYVLLDKQNVVGLLQVITAHYDAFLNSSWALFQDGLLAKSSPRDTWSHGE